jgi:membrane-associated protease RseP (regulator of RpoE activity)
MSSKLKKWYVIVGLVVGGLVICSLLVAAGGAAGYAVAQRRGGLSLQGSWGAAPSQQGPGLGPEERSQQGQSLPQAAAGSFSGQLRGALIVEVESGAPAEQAGLETGDIVIAVNNKGMDEDRDLAALIGSYDPGDEVVLTVVRQNDDTELVELEVTLGSDTDEEGNEVPLLGARYQTLSSGMGMRMLERGSWSGDESETD